MQQRSTLVIGFAAGLVFGLGLLASGMTEPAKVRGFLDLFGRWDPSLALVMGGAVAVAALGFARARRGGPAWDGSPIVLPPSSGVDRRLVFGGVLFGAGWGLAGYCPGPALVSAAAGSAGALLFTAAMLAGMALHDRLLARRR
ncbi:DUF6691 family protein [Piscinibacter sakaiensis]|uniref:Gene II and X proteins n=1 Tax=Piscinibacter sakaiensis TaxID=1547922 RepID=A0A0K8P5W2_PISS1|nr:DUF6691 family protein [Piscinibacter sakaiensis]GAP38093.1 gene II and X proteins [Piscinibacter sakaiensis]